MSFGEDIEIGADDFVEEAKIDGAHNFCGDHIFAIDGGEIGGGALVLFYNRPWPTLVLF